MHQLRDKIMSLASKYDETQMPEEWKKIYKKDKGVLEDAEPNNKKIYANSS